ncbi:MAG TPA: hypothetical protein VM032_17020 [Vicinamibacterales bacterium]|nr:hypothetical protein [Vicinamibacterales bacterium]
MRKHACLAVLALITTAACSKSPQAAATPASSSSPTAASANADGSTLKATAPTLQSPINGQQPQALEVVLTLTNAAAKYAGGLSASYRFQVFNAGGTLAYEVANVPQGSGGVTAHTVTTTLEGEQPYTWQARAEIGGDVGPWSSRANFVAPATNGYIRGNELYDPLMNGKTVGSLIGDVSWVPGVGIKLNSQLGYVAYQLPQTLEEGEFSLLVTGMPANTKGGKTKLFAMGQGFDDIVTNDRRMTIEKRGDPAGIIAWRFITHDDQVDTEGSAERLFYNFLETQTYFWQATWRGNRFNLLIREGGADGRTIYNIGKNFKGRPYDPNPHVLYLGSPVGRSGEDGASVDRAIIRQVWVSSRPRPNFANR